MKNILRNSNFGFTKWCVALIAAGWIGAAQAAPVSITASGTYTQDFNTLISTGTGIWANDSTIAAWYAQRTGTGTSIAADTGSSNGGNLYSFGSTSSSDRALGSMGSSNAAAGHFAWGVQFQNTSSSTVTIGTVSYTGEEWRKGGNTTASVVTFWYKVSSSAITSLNPSDLVTDDSATGWTAVTSLNFSSPVNTATGAALDGNASANKVAVSANSNISVPAGSYVMLRWKHPRPASGSSHGLGIDDLSVAYTVPTGGTPPTITGISPSSGLADTIVTITGTDFTGATAVSFNGVAAASYTVDSATSITATAPTEVTTGPISVTTSRGTASSTGNFTVPALSIAVSGGNSINEGDSSRTATITATPAPTSDLTVTLTSSSATDLTVDGAGGAGATATATISANTTEASFVLNAPADNTVDADASVTLAATAASGYNSGTAAVTVRNVDFNPPNVVINKFENTAVDVIELLVIGDGAPGATVDMRGMLIKDHSSDNTSDGGGKYVFSSDPIWEAVPAGTFIVLTLDDTATDANVDGYVVRVGLSNLTYFVKGTGTMNLANTDMVMIKQAGSLEAGSVGMIHALANGSPAATQTAGAGSPKLVSNVGNAGVIYASNPNSTIADYNGSSVALGAAGTIPFGSANNPANAAFIANLRGTKDISISIDANAVIINEDAGVQADKITVALSVAATTDLTVNLSATPAGIVNLPESVTIPAGSSSVTVGFTPINDNTIAGNRRVTIAGSADTWSPANNTVTVVDVQFTNPSVVINEVLNSAADSIELLVIQNNLSMVGMILKDFSGNMGGDSGGSYTFNDVALWQSVKAGTLVVLTNDATATEDTDASDGLITVKLTNTTYFTAAGSFDISGTDMIMIKSAASGASGISGAIHTFGNGVAGSLFRQANGAKLLFTAGGAGGGADNATSAIVDYNGTGVTGGTATLGAANNANNQAYITALRNSAGPIAPSSLSYTPSSISGTVEVAISSLTPTVSGTVDTYSVDPALPDGLSIDASSGVISGTPTAIAASATYTVTAANEGGSTTATVTVEVAKGTPSITAVPTASAITDGQALSASVLSGGTASVAGAFAWTTPSEVPAVGTATYGVTFTPTDTANYNTATTTVSLTVNPAGTTYSGWLNGAGASDAAFLDYVFGAATPGTLDPSLKPTVAISAGNLVLTYYVRQGTVGLTVTPKTSADLAAVPSNWITTDVTVANVGAAREVNGVSVQQKTASVPVSGAKKFLRVEAVQQ